MRLLAKRGRATLPRRILEGELHLIEFDGYTFTLHFRDRDGRDVRLELERDEGVRLSAYIGQELAKQRASLAELRKVTDALA